MALESVQLAEVLVTLLEEEVLKEALRQDLRTNRNEYVRPVMALVNVPTVMGQGMLRNK
jgi:hypothetical protein